ncbi:MAG TPA: FAD-binding domain-containing protein [Burkholderiales bacterium]|nr:FAD-binding domain-containing protein [Burkholderiales bacterium]
MFTPYRRAWLARLDPVRVEPHAVNLERGTLAPAEQSALPELESMNFRRSNLCALKMPVRMAGARELFQNFLSRIDLYRDRRDYLGVRGVSYLSVHLRFGTISIRELVRTAASVSTPGAETWLSELIWREFYFSILHHFPRVTDRAFRPEYDAVPFENREEYFRAWCEARAGFPLVDATMRQINSTGYMHNRLRMVAASFLVKDLHVDWRWGARYFAANLNDFDLAANNGGWQWCASTGCDAQPYFRIFNPVTQSKKFDPEGRFIRMYLPELSKVANEHVHEPWKMNAAAQRAGGCAIGRDYPAPIVDHDTARKKTLEMYSLARQGRRAVISRGTRTP